MLQANELRIGNKILYEGKIYTVHANTFSSIVFNDAEGILITRELYEKAKLSMPISKVSDTEYAMMEIVEDYCYGESFKYVHTLQNWYFVYSGGKELETNL